MSNQPIYGRAFSPEVVDSLPITQFPVDLKPWLLKDRKEATEGAMVLSIQKDKRELVHDGNGLEAAEKDVRKATNDLAAKGNSADRVAILTLQLAAAEGKVEYYRMKIRLLDRYIAACV